MIVRFLLPLLFCVIPSALCQVSLYGPSTVHLKAGDSPPNISFTGIVSAPDNGDWTQPNLEGKLTVLVFSLATSHNPQVVPMWNKLVEEFAGKPVQFLMLSGEQESTLQPWLRKNPIKGWVFEDPDGKTGNAYGLDQPSTVFIGSNGKILGFGFGGFPPQSSEVSAALEGRITTMPPAQATMKAFLESHQVLLQAEPFRFPKADEFKPKYPPSYSVHISASEGEGGGNFGGPDYIALRNYTLKDALGYLYGLSVKLIILPELLENEKHYDLSILVPQSDNDENLKARMQQGIQDYFHIAQRRENRLVDVYVVSAVPGASSAKVIHQSPEKAHELGGYSGGSVEFESNENHPPANSGHMKPLGLNAIRGLSYRGPAGELARMLEDELDRPVVDESHWNGEMKIDVKTDGSGKKFLDQFREQTGLVIASAQRNIEYLIFEER
jgi:uncharacterized protein (TIGR03435 family)